MPTRKARLIEELIDASEALDNLYIPERTIDYQGVINQSIGLPVLVHGKTNLDSHRGQGTIRLRRVRHD